MLAQCAALLPVGAAVALVAVGLVGLVGLESLVLPNTRATDKGLVHLKRRVRLVDLPVRGQPAQSVST